MEVELHRGISAVDAYEWDGVAGSDILSRHAWLATVEESLSAPTEFLYVLARERGRLVGAAPCHVTSDAPSSGLNRFYGRAAPIARAGGFGIDRTIVVGSRFGVSDPLLLHEALSIADREIAARELLRAIVRHAEQRNAAVLVRNADGGLYAAALEKESFQPTPELPTAYLDIVWDTVGEYRAALKKVHPGTSKAMRNVGNRAARDGMAIERITDPQSCTPLLHKLFDTHYRRLNGIAFPFSPEFLSNALQRLGNQAVLIVARDRGEIVGVDFRLTYGGRSRSLLIGIDQERGRSSATYFNLINDSITRAIESGDSRLYAGRLVYDVKLRRGYSLLDSTMWIRAHTPLQRAVLKPFVALRGRHVRRMIAKLQPAAEANAAAMSGARGKT
jgi:predicted N-acyltransferase